jgi:hypothetical protein
MTDISKREEWTCIFRDETRPFWVRNAASELLADTDPNDIFFTLTDAERERYEAVLKNEVDSYRNRGDHA